MDLNIAVDRNIVRRRGAKNSPLVLLRYRAVRNVIEYRSVVTAGMWCS